MKLSRRLDRIDALVAPAPRPIYGGVSGLLRWAAEDKGKEPVQEPMSDWCRRLVASMARDAGIDEALIEASPDAALQRLRDVASTNLNKRGTTNVQPAQSSR